LLEAQAIAKVGSWELDLNADTVIWSTETYRIFELEQMEIPMTLAAILGFVHPADVVVVTEHFANSLARDDANKSEHRIVCGNGSVKWVEERWMVMRDSYDVPVRAAGTIHDITELKNAEQQLLIEKRFTDSLIESLPGVFYLYDREGIFTRWNKNLETISGYSPEEIANMHPLEFYDQHEQKVFPEGMDSLITKGNKELIVHFYSKDNKKVPYHFTGHKISFNNKDYLIGVGVDITHRVEREQNLINYTEQIKNLTAHSERVREEERTRISREIHDELGQQITCLKMDASWLARRIPASEEIVHEKLLGMISMMDNTVKTIRRISSDLRPGVLDNLGLIAALDWQTSEFCKNTEIKCEFKSQPGDIVIAKSLATGIFRIYQEALTNILRHSKATNVYAVITETTEFITLDVSDNGQGFITDNITSHTTLGLIGMRERAAMMGGELRIESTPGVGTHVLLKIPLALNNPLAENENTDSR
jgi:PAS domain S-box-containing protein